MAIGTNNNQKEHLINEEILTAFNASKQIRVVSDDGEQYGLISLSTALEAAETKGLDLVLIAPQSEPPVAKIMNYGKYRFEQQKKSKEAKKKQHVTEVKPLRLSPVIDTHDFETKLRQATKWAEEGMKVKIDMRFRGRLITRVEVGKKIMTQFVEAMAEVATVEKKPTLEGNTMSCVLAPKKK